MEIYNYMWMEKKPQQNSKTAGVEMRYTGNLEQDFQFCKWYLLIC